MAVANMHDDLMWRCRPDLFARHVTQHMDAQRRFRAFAHIRLMAKQVASAVAQGRGRLIINTPPQHGKSMFLSRWTPVWALDNDPYLRVLTASYSRELVRRDSRFVRDEFATNANLITRLSPDSKAANRWNTMEGGGLYATTIGGPISGFTGDLLLLDDPYKGWKEAWSPTVRKDVVDWFESEFFTRRSQNATIIVLHTRWHPQDLTWYLTNKHPDDWQLIRLPALAEEGDPLGREDGEPLCAELHDLEDLTSSRSSRAIWDAVYQQDPKGLGDAALYAHFSEQRNVDESIELVRGLPLHISMDFNVRPGMHMEIGQSFMDSGDDMITCAHEIHGSGMATRQCMDAFERWWHEHRGHESYPEIHIFGDPAGNARSLTDGQSCWDLVKLKLVNMGVSFRLRVPGHAPGVKTSVDDFNEALCDVDNKVHYKVHPRCERLIIDLAEVQPDANGHPDKDTDPDLTHASDAERYRVNRLRPINRVINRGDVNQVIYG